MHVTRGEIISATPFCPASADRCRCNQLHVPSDLSTVVASAEKESPWWPIAVVKQEWYRETLTKKEKSLADDQFTMSSNVESSYCAVLYSTLLHVRIRRVSVRVRGRSVESASAVARFLFCFLPFVVVSRVQPGRRANKHADGRPDLEIVSGGYSKSFDGRSKG